MSNLICSAFVLLLFIATTADAALLKFLYDENGNLIHGNGLYYEYNDANKLVRVREKAKDGPIIAEYVYDYKGQRIKKIENGVTTYYIGKHYEERKGPTTNEKTNFYFANGQRVARKTQKNKEAPELIFYHNNHLGSADVVTDASGNLVDRIKYYPFGTVRNEGEERYSFTGKEKDSATDQYYFEARYYDPSIRHFTQADTITPNVYEPQSLNRYAYVKNNPLAFVDSSGHFATKLVGLSYSIANDFIVQPAADFIQPAVDELTGVAELERRANSIDFSQDPRVIQQQTKAISAEANSLTNSIGRVASGVSLVKGVSDIAVFGASGDIIEAAEGAVRIGVSSTQLATGKYLDAEGSVEGLLRHGGYDRFAENYQRGKTIANFAIASKGLYSPSAYKDYRSYKEISLHVTEGKYYQGKSIYDFIRSFGSGEH